MFRRIKHELNFLVEHIAVIAFAVLFCALGGILLWVNGGSGRFLFGTLIGEGGLPLGARFLIWLVVYVMYGLRLSLLWYAGSYRGFCCRRGSAHLFLAFSLTASAYLLDLIWYALFFCTHLTGFAAFILFLALCINGVVCFLSRQAGILCIVLHILVFLAEISFFCDTAWNYLLN